MADIKKLIENLYSGALFLQNRANAATEGSRNELLNDMDIEGLHDISKICCEAAGELETVEYPFKCKVGNNSEIHSKSIEDYDKLIADISAEAIKELAKQLKRGCGRVKTEGHSMLVFCESSFDQIVKNMTGGE